MPFRATFDCLWCGDAYECRGPDDLEGWAQLCSTCVGKAGDNGFLRFRLHQALTERGAAGAGPAPGPAAARHAPARPTTAPVAATPRCSPTTRRAPPNTTTGTCVAGDMSADPCTTPRGTPSWTSPAGGSTPC